MPIDQERLPVIRALTRWAAGDLEGTLAPFSEDVLYRINVDGIAVPFASSSLGKEDLRQRLELVLDTFDKEVFDVESLVHEPEFTRVVVYGHYKHKKSGERLIARIRLRYWVRNGLIVRVDERRDAQYVEAFQRFILQIENDARSA
jgi:ketosteroid isomerase-like protein